MMPVLPSPKRPSGFSIDSLVSKDCGSRPQGGQVPCGCPSSQEAMALRTGAVPPCPTSLHGLHAPHPAFLPSTAASYPEGLHHPALNFEGPHGFPHGMGSLPGAQFPPGFLPGAQPAGLVPPHMMGLQHKESFPFYTWLLARHGNYLSHRLTGAEAAYLFPFRKPKRIRTAFSPSQLLQLEHAFEKNHYVVGQERKDLALNLNLTETQVKVWFQNRRTKHKRTAQEESEHRRKRERSESESDYVDVESPPDSPPESPLSPGVEVDCEDFDDDDDEDGPSPPPSILPHPYFTPTASSSSTPGVPLPSPPGLPHTQVHSTTDSEHGAHVMHTNVV